MLKNLLSFLQYVLSHRHRLFKVLVSILKNLLEGLLVHANHLLLVFEHLWGLGLLVHLPVRLCRHLLVGEGCRWWRRSELRLRPRTKLRVLRVVLIEGALETRHRHTWRRPTKSGWVLLHWEARVREHTCWRLWTKHIMSARSTRWI